MATGSMVHTDQLPGSNPSSMVRPRYFSIASTMLLALLVYANTSIAFNKMGLNAQLMVDVPLIGLWFVLAGIRLHSAVFAAVALAPATIWGVGFFELPGMALTLADVFTVIAVGLCLATPQRLQHIKYNKLIWLLFAVCTASVVVSQTPVANLGQLIRLGLSVGLISVILSSRTGNLNKAVFYGMILWPIITMATLPGIGGLWRFISFDNMAALNAAETGDVLLGSALVVKNLFFLLPLLLLVRINKVVFVTIMLWLTVLLVFSRSRSLVIGVGAASLAYCLFTNTGKPKISKFLLLVFLGAGLGYGVSSQDFFNFSLTEGSKAASSSVRSAKMWRAWDTFTSNPVLGIGYGAAGVIDTKRVSTATSGADVHFFDVITDVKASAEFAPLQILAETGLAGGVVSVLMLIYSALRSVTLLKNPKKPIVLKLTLLCAIAVFIAALIGTNSFGEFVFWLAMPLILDGIGECPEFS